MGRNTLTMSGRAFIVWLSVILQKPVHVNGAIHWLNIKNVQIKIAEKMGPVPKSYFIM